MPSGPEEDLDSLSRLFPALNKEGLDKALSAWFAENITCTHWQFVSDAGKGDSYLSEVIRIKIYGKNLDGVLKHVRIVLKSIPRSVARRRTFRSDEFFRNEISFYENVLPELLKFQSAKNLQAPFDNYVKLFFAHCDGHSDVICLEDASTQGYVMATRQIGMNVEHCKLTLKTLARFHALSFAMKDQKPEEFRQIRNAVSEVYYAERLWDWYKRFWQRLCKIAIDAVEQEYPNSIYSKKVKEFAVPSCYTDMIRASKSFENGVILHGDAWTNNMLFKYKNGSPVDAKMIDFQLAKYASPVLDLSLVIYACTTQELRLKHYDALLMVYYESLSDHIKALGSDPDVIYSWDVFMGEVKKYSYFGLAFSFESTPFIVLEPDEAVNMEMEGVEEQNIDDVWRLGPFKTREGRLRVADNVVHCVDNGYI